MSQTAAAARTAVSGCSCCCSALTLVTTTIVGGCHYYSFTHRPRDRRRPAAGRRPSTAIFSRPAVLAARPLVQPDDPRRSSAATRWATTSPACATASIATRPFFLPAPLPLTGTLGAFIRIKSRIPNKTALFDIGIAGPLAGFVVAVPALFIGLMLSRVDRLPARCVEPDGARRAAALQVRGVAGLGPRRRRLLRSTCIRWRSRAWFGLLATALNLFPIAQLDGGHISYAVFGRALDDHHNRDDRRRDRPDVRLVELDRVDGAAADHDRSRSARITRRRSTTTSRSIAAATDPGRGGDGDPDRSASRRRRSESSSAVRSCH